ncbi:MAG: efflux RND transporter periplasmic adaptor subunit [Psychrosphaera sp.]|nr:efflux RND transporter periplasmic adaptor subunit [Psychrosphaera sp.]
MCSTVCLQAAASNNQVVHLRGVVMPAQKVKLSFAQPGIIRQLASGGSLVEMGQVIAKLDDKKAKAQLAQSQAEYRSAKSELASVKHSRDKNARLVEQNILSEVALIEADFTVTVAQEKVAVARAKLDMAEAGLIDCTVLAPFSGAVVSVNASKGEWMKQGDPFVEFVNFKKLSLSIDIPPDMADGLSVGLTTDV